MNKNIQIDMEDQSDHFKKWFHDEIDKGILKDYFLVN
jgi:hypothetical protein